ncbi:hypothetical protein Bhyg_17817, partial [Pseudolycoriella hygida]
RRLFCYYEYVATGSLANAGAAATYEKEIEKIHEDVKGKVSMCDAIGSPTNGRVRVGTCTACEESMEFLLSHDPADCTKFFLCSFGERFALECPVYNYYDPVMMLCSSDYKCSGPPG